MDYVTAGSTTGLGRCSTGEKHRRSGLQREVDSQDGRATTRLRVGSGEEGIRLRGREGAQAGSEGIRSGERSDNATVDESTKGRGGV